MSGKQSSLKDIYSSVILSILNLQILILDIHKGQALFTTSNIVSSGVVSALTAALTPTCTFHRHTAVAKGASGYKSAAPGREITLILSTMQPTTHIQTHHHVPSHS